jgi:tRNA pseudouridine38-40 synthase
MIPGQDSGEDGRRNLRLLLEYDGSRYLGWQQQAELPSIEATLLSALERMLNERPALRVAGRTDAGVHAVGQVANFHTRSPIRAEKIAPGLNYYLPDDISVHRSEEVPASFDARVDSLSKQYRYRVYRARQPAALETRAWHLRGQLDVEAMIEASRCLIGEHDFESFRSVGCQAPHAIRNMMSIDVTRQPRPPAGEHIDITFHADAYCRHMCRILSGTLVEVGQGRREVGSVAEVLAARDRRKAGMTAPPQGLTTPPTSSACGAPGWRPRGPGGASAGCTAPSTACW